MLLEGVEAFGREGGGDAAFGCPGLGGEMCEAAGAGALERAADAGCSCVEVEVFPAEPEEFAFAEAATLRSVAMNFLRTGGTSIAGARRRLALSPHEAPLDLFQAPGDLQIHP